MKTYLGIDLGGTNVRVGKIDEEGNILQIVKNPSHALESIEVILETLTKTIEEIDDYQSVSGIGLGVPGPVDQKLGRMNMATNIPALDKYPLVNYLEKRYSVPVVMDNDANVAGLAEAYFGAGEGKDIVVYITHSTGIGAGIVVNQKTISGRHGYAGEIANIIVKREGEKINHLNIGAVENEASGTALVRKSKEAFGDSIEHAGQLFDLAKAGDQKALELVDDMTTDFAIAMADIAHVLDPDVFVIGGGVTQSGDFYFDKIREKYLQFVHEGMKDIDIKLATLKEPGLVGAAMLPKSKGV